MPLGKLIELALGHGELDGLLLGQFSWLDFRVDDGKIDMPTIITPAVFVFLLILVFVLGIVVVEETTT
jgi:hypothetical protein